MSKNNTNHDTNTTFALGEDTLLRHELTTRDGACRNRDFYCSIYGLFLSIFSLTPIITTIYHNQNIPNGLSSSKPLLILASAILSMIIVLLFLSFTRFSPNMIYQERIYPGFFEQSILGYKRTVDLRYANIKVRKPTTTGRKNNLYSIRISAAEHWDINLRALTKSEVDLLMAYKKQAKHQDLINNNAIFSISDHS